MIQNDGKRDVLANVFLTKPIGNSGERDIL